MNSFSFDTNKIGYILQVEIFAVCFASFKSVLLRLLIEKSLVLWWCSAVIMKRNNLLHFESVLKSWACTCTARARSYIFFVHTCSSCRLMMLHACFRLFLAQTYFWRTKKEIKFHTHSCELSLLNSWSRSFLVFVYDIEFEVVKLFSKWCGSVDRHTNVGAKPWMTLQSEPTWRSVHVNCILRKQTRWIRLSSFQYFAFCSFSPFLSPPSFHAIMYLVYVDFAQWLIATKSNIANHLIEVFHSIKVLLSRNIDGGWFWTSRWLSWPWHMHKGEK